MRNPKESSRNLFRPLPIAQNRRNALGFAREHLEDEVLQDVRILRAFLGSC